MLSQARRLFNRVVFRGGSPYYYARKAAEIGSTPRTYLKRRSVGQSLSSEITESERAIVAAVKKNGYCVLPAPLPHTDALIAECKRRLADYLAMGQRTAEKDLSQKFYWASLLTESRLPLDSIFIKYAAQDSLMRMASEYLGAAPLLANISVQYSFQTGEAFTHSQLWHRDYDDVRIFKIFVYCTDVDEPDDGAFHVANRNALHGLGNTPLYSGRKLGDAQFYHLAGRENTEAICGPAGTTFICDTRRSFHYGSRCVTSPRLACWFTYRSYAGLYPAETVADPPANAPEPIRLLLTKH